MKKKVTLENSNVDDAEILAELSKNAFHTDVNVGPTGGPPGYNIAKFQIWTMNTLMYYKILHDGLVVGGIILRHLNDFFKNFKSIF